MFGMDTINDFLFDVARVHNTTNIKLAATEYDSYG